MTIRYPWAAFRETWAVDIDEVRVDGSSVDVVDADHLRLHVGREWRDLAIDLRVHTSEVAPDALDELSCHVLVSCTPTQLRRPFRLTRTTTKTGAEFAGSIQLSRDSVSGVATAATELVAPVEERMRTVGTGLPWTIVVDPRDAPRPPGVPPLKTTWVDFGCHEAPLAARRRAHAHAYVDLTTAPPTLFLNKAIDGLQQLILSDTAQLERRRHRDMLGAAIARQVAGSLFRAAAEEVLATDPPEAPSERVYREICEAVAAELPDIDGVEDLYARFADLESCTGAERAAFWADVDLALDGLTQLSATVARICEEAKRA